MSENIIENITEKKPKKRGRKPKQNIIKNDNPIFSSNIDNMIISIPIEKKKEDIKYYDNNDNYKEFSGNNVSKLCWNCSHKFNGLIVNIPLKFNNNIFYNYGDFCSFECASRFTCDNFNNKEKYEYLSLLNYFYNIVNKTKNKQINIPPSKFILDIYGGEMNIDEYRKINKNIYIEFPIVFLNNECISINNNLLENQKYKLYRKSYHKKTDNQIQNNN